MFILYPKGLDIYSPVSSSCNQVLIGGAVSLAMRLGLSSSCGQHNGIIIPLHTLILLYDNSDWVHGHNIISA